MKSSFCKSLARARLIVLSLLVFSDHSRVFALDAAALGPVTITPGTSITPRSIFTQTWTMTNTGTTTWTPNSSGYTLNMVGKDSLGAITLFTNQSGSWYLPSAIINSGKSVAPGKTATFSLMFIAPEAAGSYTDTFQLNGTSNFGPLATIQITVPQVGSTNQYDRSRVISYANNYAGYVASDGYFWINGSNYESFTPGTNAPTDLTNEASGIGDDCAHFVSCCIGNEPHMRGGGLTITNRVPPTYGEPGAGHIVTNLIGAGYAVEVSSLSQMSPGDLVGWIWNTNSTAGTNIANLNHVTLYLGNGLLASHAQSALDVSANTFFQSGEPNYMRFLVHIYDAPTLIATNKGKNLVMSWGTNWSSYALYSSTSLVATATWTKVTKSPTKMGNMNVMTNTMSTNTGATFYRLMMP